MHFHDDSLFPENQEKLVIQAAPYGPEWLPGDADDLPLTMDEHVQAAVDCYNAGATVLHIHVRELDGKGSKRMSMFNELLGRLRQAVPDMVLQIGGSISFAPEDEGSEAKWLSYDTRHLLADLDPAPDQVTIAINTSQMNIVEIMSADDLAGTSIAKPEYYKAYRDMVVEAGPDFYLEHLERLRENGIQPHFQLATLAQLETVERLIRAGVHTGPLILNYVAIGGGFAGRHPADLIEFVRRTPDGAVLTIESSMRAVAPMNAIGIALGVHVRVGNEDNLWRRKGERMTTVEQIEQMVQISEALGRDIATGAEAKRIYKLGEHYCGADETLARLGMVPNRRPGQRGPMLRVV
ncbi:MULTISPECIES: 3-keto-5-aminohexanoate cleavage protein [unclassified Streptomyces]|uniref:3-keto-5-aminohexanoate cleavage protein n=1 Tax=unclassified Streptomyces TaxID=2593676 RepID=UPI002E12F279|nr:MULTISPECIES: 3-keto-5-aminohexanoate cleavage protein [unclassified Streptomyces]WSR23685.1 3-keto-5-aminohexanoate cleavage protein [Streptomyces sp. NBC_01205]